MINQHTNYQASFSVKDPEKVVINRFRSIVFDWLKRKEKDGCLRRPQAFKDFSFRSRWENLWSTRSMVASNTFLHEEDVAWALQYHEKKPGGQMFWYTDIGLDLKNEILSISVRISYAWNIEDLSHDREEPKATIPRFIKQFFAEAGKENWHVFSQNETFRISEKPFPVARPGDGTILANWIMNSERQFPLIVFNGRALVKEAVNLSYNLVGKANIIVIDDNRELAEELTQNLPFEFRIPFGKFRIYFRIHPNNLRPERHRWFTPTDPEYPEQKVALINSLLRNHSVPGTRTVESIADISRKISLSRLRKLAGESPENAEQLEAFEELLLEAEKEIATYRKEAEFFAAEHSAIEAQLTEQKYQYEGKIHALEATGARSERSTPILSGLPKTLGETVDAIEPYISERVVILPQAKEAAYNYQQCPLIDDCWKMLLALHNILHPLKFEEKALDEKTFLDRTGISYAKTEGKQTKNDAKLSALRRFDFKGETLEMWQHLKVGNKGDKILRIHFAFHEPSQRIIVGHIGPHMDNASTRNL